MRKSIYFRLHAYNSLDAYIYTIGKKLAKEMNNKGARKFPTPLVLDKSIHDSDLGKNFACEYLSYILSYYQRAQGVVYTSTISEIYDVKDEYAEVLRFTLQLIVENIISGAVESINLRKGRMIPGVEDDRNINDPDIYNAILRDPGYDNASKPDKVFGKISLEQLDRSKSADILLRPRYERSRSPSGPRSRSPPKSSRGGRTKSSTKKKTRKLTKAEKMMIESGGYKVDKLKGLLRERGLPVSGRKAELEQRLLSLEG